MALDGGRIETFQQPRQFAHRPLHRPLIGARWPLEALHLQAPVPDPETIAIPHTSTLSVSRAMRRQVMSQALSRFCRAVRHQPQLKPSSLIRASNASRAAWPVNKASLSSAQSEAAMRINQPSP